MTIQEIKKQLPDVKVSVDGQTQVCHIYGRKLDFATVYTTIGNFEFAWSTIQRHLETGRLLKL